MSVTSDVTNKVVANISVGWQVQSIAYDTNQGSLIVANQLSNNVSVISDFTNTIETSVTVGSNLVGVAFDIDNGQAYVANHGQGTISIITIGSAPSTYSVTFSQSGLPASTSWPVTLNGSTKSSTTAKITFQEPNGSYTFSVGSVSGYTVGPSPGTIKVNGAAVSQPITFTSSTSPGKGNQTTGFLGLPGYDGYLVVGIIVAAVAAGALILLLRKRSPPRGSGSVQDSKNIADGAASQVAVE